MRAICLGHRRRLEAAGGGESGVTLVELSIALVTLLVLFAMTVPIVDTVFATVARVNNTYTNVNQLLPVSTNLQRFVRSAVEPGPSTNGVPDPPYVTGATSPTSMTFYTNVGDPNGPAEIVASCQSANPSTGLCDAGGTFTVTEAHANAGTCPPAGSGCTWGAARTLITVNGVSNANDNAPLFVYTLIVNSTSSSGTTTTTTPEVGSGCSSPSCFYSDDASAFASCTSTPTSSSDPLANCKSDEIYAVTIDLQVNGVSTGRTAGGQSEDDSTVYRLSPDSANYQPMVG